MEVVIRVCSFGPRSGGGIRNNSTFNNQLKALISRFQTIEDKPINKGIVGKLRKIFSDLLISEGYTKEEVNNILGVKDTVNVSYKGKDQKS